MFSGIVEAVGRVRSLREGEGGARLGIEASAIMEGVKPGDSIAVNGACLTVSSLDAAGFEADLSPETLRRTNLGLLRVGEGCNLERALALGERLGGHLVTGHVDAVGRLRSRRTEGDSIWLTVGAPEEVMRYVVLKGSVAVDGISLTVAGVEEGAFSVAVIPHTSGRTTLAAKADGAPLNLEADLIGKYVEKLLAPHAQAGEPARGITLEALKAFGYA
ncbi:MAG: riboflavin synthase [Candidatus Tectomicrobia bacterium]|uniref:Riboflavin synthase n=1 Tax=Tectimicrobiota bacterium TaxID=2528274 RepID=A0A933E8W5_UNCTE|nr:riboflavin synthase [Candidatus Tectomicrobia bacterium]